MSEPTSPLPPPTPSPSATGWAPARANAGVLGGVCSGLAVAAGVDVTLVRLAFVAAGLSGFGIVAYIVLWIVLPRESPQRPLVPAPPETARWLGIGLLVAAVVGLLGILGRPWFGPWDGAGIGGSFWLGAVLLAIGGLVLWSNRRTSGSSPNQATFLAAAAPGSTLPPPAGPPAGATQPLPAGGAGQPPFGPSGPAVPPQAPATPGSGGLLVARVFGWFTLITAVPAVLALIVAQSLGIVEISLPGLVWTAIAVSLLGLFVVLVAVRQAWAVAVAIAGLAVATVLTAALSSFEGEVGERIEQPATVDELQIPNLAAGRLVLDLSRLDLPEGTLSVPVEAGAGQVEIILPADAAVRAEVSVRMGEAQVLGRTRSGLSVEVVRTDTPTPSSGSIDLDVELGAGQVVVCRPGPGIGGSDGCGVNTTN
jgi:phage shock protein PspC (stress-responsive transcriptional regulator)